MLIKFIINYSDKPIAVSNPFIRNENLQTETTELLSPALNGSPLTNQEFINWIEQAETTPTISLQEAKSRWANQREQLLHLIK